MNRIRKNVLMGIGLGLFVATGFVGGGVSLQVWSEDRKKRRSWHTTKD